LDLKGDDYVLRKKIILIYIKGDDYVLIRWSEKRVRY
jgi:hypothetical protein